VLAIVFVADHHCHVQLEIAHVRTRACEQVVKRRGGLRLRRRDGAGGKRDECEPAETVSATNGLILALPAIDILSP
jgi:hypothetical protein